MSVNDFFIVFVAVAITMLACRVLPVFLLKGRQLPETVVRALNFIPPAAFAALVANDLFDPAKVTSGDVWSWLAPLIAAAFVVGRAYLRPRAAVGRVRPSLCSPGP